LDCRERGAAVLARFRCTRCGLRGPPEIMLTRADQAEDVMWLSYGGEG
jgi:hypothetical protein